MLERREDKVRNAHGLGIAGYILALRILHVGAHSLSVVGAQEDSVRARETNPGQWPDHVSCSVICLECSQRP